MGLRRPPPATYPTSSACLNLLAYRGGVLRLLRTLLVAILDKRRNRLDGSELLKYHALQLGEHDASRCGQARIAHTFAAGHELGRGKDR